MKPFRARPRGPGFRARRNPVPPSSKSLTTLEKQGISLFKRFTGHDVEWESDIELPDAPPIMIQIGKIDGILYTTRRDGKKERYIHEFHRGSEPIFAVTPDGKMIYLIGGNYDFTERGIVDTDAAGRPLE
jgi:hypothetical protein